MLQLLRDGFKVVAVDGRDMVLQNRDALYGCRLEGGLDLAERDTTDCRPIVSSAYHKEAERVARSRSDLRDQLVLEAIQQTFASVGCTASVGTEFLEDIFFGRMDGIAKTKLEANGFSFPEKRDDFEKLYDNIYDDLIERGEIKIVNDGEFEKYPNACKEQ